MSNLYIDRLYIGDFGIYQNENIEGLNNGLVLIGGLNRAGKSSLLKILKNLSYGFTKGEVLPPPNIQYNVESKICKNKEIYNLKLEGYRKPIINPNVEENLYPIDKNTYSQLFTIDLDLLNTNFSDDKEIQTILLGAGFKDVLKVPTIIKELNKESEKIGGKQGSPNTKQFKPLFNIINKNLKEREAAIKERDSYIEANEELKNIEEKITRLNCEKDKIKIDLGKLKVIFENYEDYIKLVTLEESIKIGEDKLNKYKSFSMERLELFKNEYVKLRENLKEKVIK